MSFHKLRQLRLSPKARQDIIDILNHTGATWSEKQLLIYRDKVNAALKALSRNPKLGHHRNDLPSTHLAYLVGAHIIVFRMREDEIAVVRILHQRMSLGKHI